MNKDMITGGSAVVLVVLLAWFIFGSSSTSVPVVETPEAVVEEKAALVAAPKKAPTPAPKVVPVSDNTFQSIFAETGSHKCSYESVTGTTKSSNVIYLADRKMRGEFRSTVVDKTTNNLMVYDGQYLYSWQEGMAIGTRSRLTSVKELPAAIPEDLTSAAVLGQGLNSVSWDCHPWIKDASLIKPPSYVKFQ